MPLTRMQFDLGIDADIEGWMRKIHQFLAANHTQAYSREELAEQFKIVRVRFSPLQFPTPEEQQEFARFETSLATLVATRNVKQKEVQGKDYYAALTETLQL